MQVQVFSDVVCPWCAIGRARFGRAMDQLGEDPEIRWRSFQLDPTTPAVVDGSYVEMLAGKYRTSTAEAQGMVDRMTADGAAEGIDFRFDRARPGNTFDAHRLLHLALDRGIQDQVKAHFLDGYHTGGVAIGNPDELTSLAVDAGLDEAEVRDVLATDRYADDVRADLALARELEVTGVPFFVLELDGHQPIGVPGAQTTDVFVQVVQRARARVAED